MTTWIIGRKLILLNFEKLKREATFRFSLVRLRENAESIAFLRGEATEAKTVDDRFQRVVANMHDINVAERNLDFFTTLYNYTVWILPVVVVAPEYFAGGVALGVVQQAANAFSHVLDDVSVIINQFESLSEFAAGIDRLFQFYIAIRAADLHRQESAPLMTKLAKETNDGDIETGIDALHDEQTIVLRQMGPKSQYNATQAPMALSVQDLSLFTPDDKRVLFRRLSFSVPWGQQMLIAGNSGIGKSSLLRAVAGLWTSGTGMIERPHDADVYFLPQRPYCALGSLRDQLLYPRLASNNVQWTKVAMKNMLSLMVLSGRMYLTMNCWKCSRLLTCTILRRDRVVAMLCLGLNAETDWSSILSLGEQQRLAFGRILVNRPSFVILDESTSALDVASESRMYSLLRDT